MLNSEDLVVDLETTGTVPGCGILAIGAYALNSGMKFYEKINVESCRQVGLIDSLDTMIWWNKQDPAAKAEAFSGTFDIITVLGKFSDFMRSIPASNSKIFIWGNGADFDNSILRKAYEVVGIKDPCAPFNARCYRTMKNLYPDIKMPPFLGMKHNALSDAYNQGEHLKLLLKHHFSRSQD